MRFESTSGSVLAGGGIAAASSSSRLLERLPSRAIKGAVSSGCRGAMTALDLDDLERGRSVRAGESVRVEDEALLWVLLSTFRFCVFTASSDCSATSRRLACSYGTQSENCVQRKKIKTRERLFNASPTNPQQRIRPRAKTQGHRSDTDVDARTASSWYVQSPRALLSS
jgi:hypothetical protein